MKTMFLNFTSLAAATLLAGALTLALPARAATATWNGGGASDNWSDSANWDTLPNATGDDLVFSGTTRPTPVNDLVTAANSVTLNPGASFFLGGNAITLSAGLTNSALSNNWNIATMLVANQNFSAAPGTTLRLGGIIGGNVLLGYYGGGTYVIDANNTNFDSVTIDAATVRVNSGKSIFRNNTGYGFTFKTVTLQNGGTVEDFTYGNVGGFWGKTGDGAGNLVIGTGGGTYRMLGASMNSAVNKGITVNSGVTGRFEVPTGNSCNWSGAAFAGRDFIVNSGGTLVFGGGGNFTTSRFISGAGSIQKTDGGTLTLSNVVCTYTGSTILTSGTLALTNSAAINSSSNILIAAGATFDVSAIATYNLPAPITGSGTGTTVGTTAATIKGGTTVISARGPSR